MRCWFLFCFLLGNQHIFALLIGKGCGEKWQKKLFKLFCFAISSRNIAFHDCNIFCEPDVHHIGGQWSMIIDIMLSDKIKVVLMMMILHKMTIQLLLLHSRIGFKEVWKWSLKEEVVRRTEAITRCIQELLISAKDEKVNVNLCNNDDKDVDDV